MSAHGGRGAEPRSRGGEPPRPGPSSTAGEDRSGWPPASILVRALVIGVLFGFVLVRSEALSWYRIQEMFRFQSFHMYGILGSAVLTALVSMRILRALGLRMPDGRPCGMEPKELGGRNTRYWAGGTTFGLGWGILGACPGPIYTLIGAGYTAMLISLVAALAGTWTYGALRDRLPHY